MDLREKKTKRNITNAFLQLRAQKPLERITIKELAGLAEISKATFYLHYHDIYDLSDTLEKEIIQDILDGLPHADSVLSDTSQFFRELIIAFHAQQHLIEILFSGSRANILPYNIEQGIRQHIFQRNPDLRDDAAFNTRLTYQILGCYYAYTENRHLFGEKQVLDALDQIMQTMMVSPTT
ncbi:TetR/AcrR family transcriptional regulator [Hespellia stercorisuis]|uniref:Transcriptional regulator, TetR family n=1 Tax=Hespellia stercorisuis DSM 15480 TaxID=1121950 RepID=A0A1M6M5I2_9FIRM|nr:TetR/AcrR family transcriptional regulator [Hespellia stercorisuis]SHJ78735.1 transcriptional regulator, TetR family [Hespellia stercorisuis DSM 15480]